jgi:succinate dehydrogenase / fumarate reductase flavoprotein subunit
MLDLVVIDGKARGIIVRNLDTGEIERHAAHAVVLATGGYGKIYYLSTLAMGCNGSAIWRAHKRCFNGFSKLDTGSPYFITAIGRLSVKINADV